MVLVYPVNGHDLMSDRHLAVKKYGGASIETRNQTSSLVTRDANRPNVMMGPYRRGDLRYLIGRPCAELFHDSARSKKRQAGVAPLARRWFNKANGTVSVNHAPPKVPTAFKTNRARGMTFAASNSQVDQVVLHGLAGQDQCSARLSTKPRGRSFISDTDKVIRSNKFFEFFKVPGIDRAKLASDVILDDPSVCHQESDPIISLDRGHRKRARVDCVLLSAADRQAASASKSVDVRPVNAETPSNNVRVVTFDKGMDYGHTLVLAQLVRYSADSHFASSLRVGEGSDVDGSRHRSRYNSAVALQVPA